MGGFSVPQNVYNGLVTVYVWTTANDPERDKDFRTWLCGCIERWLEGDIVTSQFSGWVLIHPCETHNSPTTH